MSQIIKRLQKLFQRTRSAEKQRLNTFGFQVYGKFTEEHIHIRSSRKVETKEND